MPARRRLIIFAALRALNSALRRGFGRLRGARFRLPGVGWAFNLYCPSGTGFRPQAELGTPARRAARWGRLWGYAPFAAPLASPPKHPLRGLSTSLAWRGQRGLAAGASLARCSRSGDLPPRRVNARIHFRFEWYSASANIPQFLD